MPIELLLTPLVNLAIGAALLLAWRYDRSQPFTQWIGWSFAVNSTWIVGYWLWFQAEPMHTLGVAAYAAQSALSLLFLIIGVWQMRGRSLAPRPMRALGLAMFLVLTAAALVGTQSVLSVNAIIFALVAVPIARQLWQGALAERVAAVMVLLNAVVWWITPLLGFEQLQVQTVSVAAVRLMLGLSLLVACLEHTATAARRLNEQVTRLTERSHQGVLVLQDGQPQYANPELLRIFRLQAMDELPAGMHVWGTTANDRLLNDGRRAQLHDGAVASVTWSQQWMRAADGVELHLRLTAWVIDWNGRPAEQVVVSDETEVHASAQRLIYEATHDRLTGLVNRVGAEDLMAQALRTRRDTPGAQFALILVDIDRFSAVNDAFGYTFGDELLRQLAQRLERQIGETATMARVAGDEFLVLQPSSDAKQASGALAEQLLELLRQPLTVQSVTLNVSGSAGVAVYPDDGDTFGLLLGHANLAAKNAKLAGRNVVRFFSPAMNAELLDEMRLANEMHDALRERQFELYCQPIVDARTRELVGAEALLRWNHPELGLVSPARFVPIAERTGLIVDIGGWVIDAACAMLRQWQAVPGLSRLVLSINVSATQFGRGDVDRVVAAALDRHGTDPQRLELEVTESALIHEPEQFVELLGRLRQLGVRLAIDDFGTGYSNLSYLQRFKVDKLKVDQSFVRGLTTGSQDRAIVKAIVQMASSLGLKTIAEGIEDADTLQAVVQAGCDLAQGYHFARPLPRPAFEAWCAAWAPAPVAVD